MQFDLASISTAGSVQRQQHNSLKYISNVAAQRKMTAKSVCSSWVIHATRHTIFIGIITEMG